MNRRCKPPSGNSRAGTPLRRPVWTGFAAVFLGVFCALPTVIGAGADATETAAFAAAVRRDTAWFGAPATRLVGTKFHDAVMSELLDRVRSIPGIKVWSQEFSLVAPQIDEAFLEVPAGKFAGKHRVFPVWPASVRLPSTPTGGIDGKLVYVTEGDWKDIRPRSLRGQIAVMEMTGDWRWTAVANAGARAILLLGSPGIDYRDAQSQLIPLPVNVPRFYLPDGALAAALRADGVVRARVFCRAHWARVRARNILALVLPAAAPVPPRQALAVAVQCDSAGAIVEKSPSADGAVDVAFLLNLLRQFAAERPARPVLFAFLDGQGINQLGARQMLAALAITKKEKKANVKADVELLADYRHDLQLAAELGRERDPLAALYREKFRDLHQYVKDEVAREVVQIETVMHPKRLKLYRAAGEEKERLRREVAALSDRRSRYFGAQLRLLTKESLTPALRGLAQKLWDRVQRRLDRQANETRELVAREKERDTLRQAVLAALGLPPAQERPIEFLLGIDLSDAGVAAGPALYCRFLFTNESRNAASFTRWLNDVTRDKDARPIFPETLRRAVDLGPLAGLDSPDSFICGDPATLTGNAESFGTAGVTWATLNAIRTKADTPLDTVERLDWSRLAPQIEATFLLARRLADSPGFKVTSKVVPKWVRAWGTIVDQASGEPIPRLPMPDYLAVLVNGSSTAGRGGVYFLPAVPGVRRQEFHFTRADGRFYVDAMPGLVGGAARRYFVQAYLLAEDGRIVRAVDMKKAGKGVSLNIDTRTHDPTPLRAVMFTCQSLQGFDFFDPRFLLPLPMASLLDARRGGEPRRVNFSLSNGMLSAMLEPETRWELILRAGVTRNRLALVNMAPPSEWKGLSTRQAMRGFEVGKPLPAHPLYLAARDFYRLDTRRIEDYRRAGISSRAIGKIRERTKRLLTEAEAAVEADDGSGLYRAAGGAVANEIRAYQAVRDMANDVIRGAIFLLLALAPFAFAMERLIFASPHVYRQIAGTVGIFSVMTLILWSFHPAFRITNQPLMIIMAFGIILMSLLVISVVFSRFEAGLDELRSGRAEASGARTSRFGVVSTAIRLGIANMRKRKLRTALTGITIMLITFALLCFTSTSRYVGTREYRIDANAPYAGVLVRQPSSRAMPGLAATYLKEVAGRERVVRRYWWCNPWNPQWRLHLANPKTGKQVSLHAALGLDGAEGDLTNVRRFCPKWDEFSTRSDGCYLSKETARELGVEPGETVVIAGRAMRLIGTYDAAAMDRGLRGLDGQSLLPMDYSAVGDEQRRLLARGDLELMAIEMESGAGLEPDQEVPRLSGASVVIVPADMLEGLNGSSLRSLAVKTKSGEAARVLVEELTRRLAFPIYYGSPESGVRVVATTPLLPKAPKSLLIPLVIAGFIIFNTMLSSIAERRREIYIYTSIGLAPLHVGFLFLAEAVTYGLMGSIFGYIIGQALATVFSKLGWMGGITLNYSGTQTIAVMVMVLAVVVLSSLVPAYLAGKLAAPSNEMNWRVPEAVDDVIRDNLPFTANRRVANGVMTFILDYLDAHREGSIGNFSTDDLRAFRTRIDGREFMGIEGTVWLAPYDLGVRQRVRITFAPADIEDILCIGIELKRESGQPGSWHKLNRVFLGDLRRQLLGWRKLKPERILAYIAESRGRLAEVPA
ncbi:MAG: hypothetical protein GXP31_18720 [Kiritimatiellaeota bacterium]|nr:hypothetical protein [Kiritimatiellota bacterium]